MTEPFKPALSITTDEWRAKQQRGLATMIDNRMYIVMTHASTNEPVYQPVTILDSDPHP